MAHKKRLAGIFADLDPIDAERIDELDGNAVVRINSVEAWAVHEELLRLRTLRLEDPEGLNKLLNETRRGRHIVPSAFPEGWLDVSKEDAARGLQPGIGVLLAGMSAEDAFLIGFLVGRRAGDDAGRQLARELCGPPGAAGGHAKKGRKGALRHAIERAAEALHTTDVRTVLEALADSESDLCEDLFGTVKDPIEVHAFELADVKWSALLGRVLFSYRDGRDGDVTVKRCANILAELRARDRGVSGNGT